MVDVDGSVDAGNPEPTVAPVAPVAPLNLDLASIQNENLRGWAETKGFQNGTTENVLNSYRNLEKLFGADKAGHTIMLPTDDTTPVQHSEFFTKLGRPEEAVGYELKPAEGEDTKFAEWAGATFHKAGLSKVQATAIASAWAEFSGAHIQTSKDDAEIATTNATAALKKEWGAAFDQKVAKIDQTAAALGMTDDQLTGLRTAMGSVEAMKFVDSLGAQIGDDVIESGEGQVTGLMTPAAARAALDVLTGNKEFNEAWLDKMHPNHKNVVARKSELSRMISPPGEAA